MNDNNPLIFYRLKRKVKEDSYYPNLELTNYYKKDPFSKVSIQIIPDLSSCKNDKLIEKTKEKWEKI